MPSVDEPLNSLELSGDDDFTTINMSITPAWKTFMQQEFDIEIEMLQNPPDILPDGRLKYSFTLTDTQKIRYLRAFCVMLMNANYAPGGN